MISPPSEMARVCDSCTACCKPLPIPELKKPAGKWCSHCDVGKGCMVYASRPQPCQEFRCEWLKGWGRVEDRPDRVKVIPDFVVIPETLFAEGVLQMWEVTKRALQQPFAEETTRFAIERGIWVVHIPLRGRNRIFAPQGERVTEEVRQAVAREGWIWGNR